MSRIAMLALLLAGCIEHHAIAQPAPAPPPPHVDSRGRRPVAWKDLIAVIPLHGALDHIFGPGTKAHVHRLLGFDVPF